MQAGRLYRNAKREALIVAVVWFVATAWTVSYCYLNGYQHDAESWVVRQGWAVPRDPGNFRMIAGVPDWVAIGILLPWVLCSSFTIFFSLVIMQDDELGSEAGEGEAHGH